MDTLTRQLIHSNMYEQTKRELREEKALNARLQESNEKLLEMLSKFIGTLEEAFEKDPTFLHVDNALDYEDAVKLANKNGSNYRAKSSILSLIR